MEKLMGIHGFTKFKSISSLLATILTLTSKKLTEDLDFSCVHFKLGWKLLVHQVYLHFLPR